jgi:ArsR family transcriptional regulator
MEKKYDKSLKEISRVFAKLSHPIRLELVLKLMENKCCVKEIGEIFDIPQPSVSQHLKQLREAGIVVDQRKGNNVNYCIEDEWIIELVKAIKNMTNIKKK